MNATKGFADLFKRELGPETKNDHWASLISDGVPEVGSIITTRADGTGLGLSLVHSIVRLHGGSLEIGPSPYSLGGACIRFHIPKSPLR